MSFLSPDRRTVVGMRRSTVLMIVTIAFAVLYGAASIALGTPPDASESAASVLSWFGAHDGNVRLWLWLLTLGGPLFAVYAAIIRGVLPTPHRDVFLFGAIAFAVETAVQGWIWAALALHPHDLTGAEARLVLDIALYWGPVLTATVIMMLAPVAAAVLAGRTGLPRWVGLVAAVAVVEQLIETLTIFGKDGFFAPGGPLNLDVGAGVSAIALIALGITAARWLAAQPRENVA
jgi:hypothetical protein